MENNESRPENATSLDALKLWATRHDEGCRQRWAQHEQLEATVTSQAERLNKLEKRVLVLATLAAAGGGVAGQIIVKLFSGM